VRNRIVENPHIDFAGYGKIGARKEPSGQKSVVVCKGLKEKEHKRSIG
jgi:hypothetical protein